MLKQALAEDLQSVFLFSMNAPFFEDLRIDRWSRILISCFATLGRIACLPHQVS